MTKKQTTIDSLSELPDWLNSRTWSAFREHRKKIKRPMTQYAEELIQAKLDAMRLQGHDPNSLLDEAIERGWTSVFEPKQGQPVNGAQQPVRQYMTSVQPDLTPEERQRSAEAKQRVMAKLRPNLRRVG